MSSAQVLTPLLAELRERYEKLNILETGTIRGEGDNYRANDGWSTLTFALDVAQHGGRVTSIDLDTATAAKVLDAHGLLGHVKLIEAHSIAVLADMLADHDPVGREPFHLIYLDSDNDANLILHEFLLASRLVRAPGYILVDDVDMESDGVVKGHSLIPWLDAHGVTYRIEERRSDDYATGVLVIPFES